MVPEREIRSVALKQGLVTQKILTELTKKAEREHTTLTEQLLLLPDFSEEKLYTALAKRYDLPFITIDSVSLSKDIVQRIPESFAERHSIMAYEYSPEGIGVAICEEPDPAVIGMLEKKLGLPVHVSFTTPKDIHRAHLLYRYNLEQEIEKIDPKREQLDVVNLVDGLIENAIKQNASDIHIEPREKHTVVRYRVDGRLRDAAQVPSALHDALISRIKILAGLKLEEHRQPQDGRFSISGVGYKVSIRASTVPLLDHEKAVMRILRQDKRVSTLTELGLLEDMQADILGALKKRHGIILVTGPTGSGKTTTLYTVLTLLDQPDINISTIEDPIEYSFESINQSQVNPAVDYTFDVGLRGLLRQDPDVIMIGEIRDMETGTTALRAALTGHMVLSTLHTNDAASTLTRLQEMGVQNYLIASTVNVAIAQRLARHLCDVCKKCVPFSSKDRQELTAVFGEDVDRAIQALGKQGQEPIMCEPVGCPKCEGGFRGRIGIFEMLKNTPDIYEAIIVGKTAKEIEHLSRLNGARSLAEDGIRKVLMGMTTSEELIQSF